LEPTDFACTLALELPAEAAQDVRAFVVEESRCRPFFSFEIDEVAQGLRLAIRIPPGGAAMLDALQATFAGDATKLRASTPTGSRSPACPPQQPSWPVTPSPVGWQWPPASRRGHTIPEEPRV
jgi:hypothetical protein